MSEFAVFAPAGVNLIGEHPDYSGGLVLPVAIDLGVTVDGRQDEEAIRLRSLAFSETVELANDGAAQGLVPGWGRYVAAVARLLGERGRPPVGVRRDDSLDGSGRGRAVVVRRPGRLGGAGALSGGGFPLASARAREARSGGGASGSWSAVRVDGSGNVVGAPPGSRLSIRLVWRAGSTPK